MPKPKPKPKHTPPPKKREPAKPSQKDEPAMKHQSENAQAANVEANQQRGAGTGEEAVVTREREYNESVPGAFPPVTVPTKEQKDAIRKASEVEAAPHEENNKVKNP